MGERRRQSGEYSNGPDLRVWVIAKATMDLNELVTAQLPGRIREKVFIQGLELGKAMTSVSILTK
jgi:hypothetical protein